MIARGDGDPLDGIGVRLCRRAVQTHHARAVRQIPGYPAIQPPVAAARTVWPAAPATLAVGKVVLMRAAHLGPDGAGLRVAVTAAPRYPRAEAMLGLDRRGCGQLRGACRKL
ncbi:hypothetical protein CKO28_02405 [Rhodovibrio sodomensis]|uniref:Uncharacterized protein n=1 Tax=Rhodovibrio sodomensis TaxID=1088 RepID=A0ABS1D908_9PROT|nr:hypothetical protein [Rhodovibrio sodomensis]